jgi:hypothetical protein
VSFPTSSVPSGIAVAGLRIMTAGPRSHADALFHDRRLTEEAVHALVDNGIARADQIHVSQRQIAPKPALGLSAGIGAIIGAGLTFALVLAASLWAPAPRLHELVLAFMAGAALGSLVGMLGAGLMPLSLRVGQRATPRDFVVSVDAEGDNRAKIQRALVRHGGNPLPA